MKKIFTLIKKSVSNERERKKYNLQLYMSLSELLPLLWEFLI